MLRWFRRTYPSYNLQPLLLKRYRELEEARAFNSAQAAALQGSRASSRRNPTTRPFSWGLNPVALPQSQSSRASSSSGQSRRSLPLPSFDQLARDIEAA